MESRKAKRIRLYIDRTEWIRRRTLSAPAADVDLGWLVGFFVLFFCGGTCVHARACTGHRTCSGSRRAPWSRVSSWRTPPTHPTITSDAVRDTQREESEIEREYERKEREKREKRERERENERHTPLTALVAFQNFSFFFYFFGFFCIYSF